MSGSVIYSQKTALPSVQEGTSSLPSVPSTDFFVPFDNTADAVTSVALTNPGDTASGPVPVTIRYTDGTSETASYPAMAARNHRGFVISGAFPGTANRSGVAEFALQCRFQWSRSGSTPRAGSLPSTRLRPVAQGSQPARSRTSPTEITSRPRSC